MARAAQGESLEVGGRQIALRNADKVLYPQTGFTKREVVGYYRRLAPVLVPHLRDRPLTLKRYPDGVDGEHFYEKQCPSYAPGWLPTIDVPSGRHGTIRYCTIHDEADLVWLATMANLELHPVLARAPDLDHPTEIVFDLDPGPPAGMVESARVALLLRDALEGVGLRCLAKSSGSKGVHLVVPLDGQAAFDDTKPFARSVAQLMERHWPDLVVSSMRKDVRAGRVLVDWSQNDGHKSTVAPYSLRARARPTVAAPVRWDEVEAAVDAGDGDLLLIEAPDMIARVREVGDLHADAISSDQSLPGAGGVLGTYRAKRDFTRSPEPLGGDGSDSGDEAQPTERARFVIQEHDATRLHWDLRLEHDGVLASWALARGVPWTPGDNRLAVHTEDHPLEYLEFSGHIPDGTYGAGRMTIWDRGEYEVEKFEERKVQVVLHGERVQGRYALFPIDGRDWLIHRMDPPTDPTRERLPGDLMPMRAVPGRLPADEDRFAYEILWPGRRVVATASGGQVILRAGGVDDVSDRFPDVRRMGRALGAVEVVLDGVLVALEQGRPNPDPAGVEERLAAADERAVRRVSRRRPAALMLFDVLWHEGHPVTDRPYTDRRELLEGLGLAAEAWQTPAAHHGDGGLLLDAARAQSLAGLVAKRLGSPYEPGVESASWVEIWAT